MEPDMSEILKENDQLKAENLAWSNQWKAYTSTKSDYWELRVRKPRVVMGSLSTIVGGLLSQDVEKLYKLYLVVAVVCTIASTLVGVYRDLRYD